MGGAVGGYEHIIGLSKDWVDELEPGCSNEERDRAPQTRLPTLHSPVWKTLSTDPDTKNYDTVPFHLPNCIKNEWSQNFGVKYF